ncbi:MAG TPA: hypothetical protein VHH73_12530, partial [Verrucomicrobiae bacterium]|nr:hypothetical protein [Verrucomicrobiae bacterium]
MNRRDFVRRFAFQASALALAGGWGNSLAAETKMPPMDPAQARDWLARWEKSILADERSRYCDKEMGEELGWLVSPFLNGFHYGYRATGDTKWVALLIDWMDSCIKRAVKEPDGCLGWPKGDGGGGDTREYSADSLLGEAMMLRPVVLMADRICKTPTLNAKWGDAARGYIDLAERVFAKWDSRACWREV